MTDFFIRLLGLKPEAVKSQPTASRLKVATLGQLLLIPTAIWFVSAFLMAYRLVQAPWYIALLTAVLCAAIIFAIDRSFVNAHGQTNRGLMLIARLVFALLSGLLGSIALDTVIFAEDIAHFQKKQAGENFEKEKTAYFNKHTGELARMQQSIAVAEKEHEQLRKVFIDEMDGKGTGLSGYGKVARQKKKAAEKARTDLLLLHAKRQAHRSRLDSLATGYAQSQTAIGRGTIITKIRDLHAFVFSDRLNMAIYILFFMVVMLAECMLILYKAGAARTVLDELIMVEEEVHRSRYQSLQRQRRQYDKAVAELGENDVQEVRRLVG